MKVILKEKEWKKYVQKVHNIRIYVELCLSSKQKIINGELNYNWDFKL